MKVCTSERKSQTLRKGVRRRHTGTRIIHTDSQKENVPELFRDIETKDSTNPGTDRELLFHLTCIGFRELFKTDRLHHAGIDTGSAVDAYLLIAFRSVFIVQLKRFGRALCYAATASYAKIKINCYGHLSVLLL